MKVMSTKHLRICAHLSDMSGREKSKRTMRFCWLVCTEIFGITITVTVILNTFQLPLADCVELAVALDKANPALSLQSTSRGRKAPTLQM